MNLQSLQQLKMHAVDALLALLAPHMVASSQLKTPDGQPQLVWFKRDANGRSETIQPADSNLQPVYAITAEGVLQNCYGNAAIRTWDRVGIEDVVRLADLVKAEVAATAAQVVEEPRHAWAIESLNVLERGHKMATVRGRQRYPNGMVDKFAFAVSGSRPVTDMLSRYMRWTPGDLGTFLNQLCMLGYEVDTHVAV